MRAFVALALAHVACAAHVNQLRACLPVVYFEWSGNGRPMVVENKPHVPEVVAYGNALLSAAGLPNVSSASASASLVNKTTSVLCAYAEVDPALNNNSFWAVQVNLTSDGDAETYEKSRAKLWRAEQFLYKQETNPLSVMYSALYIQYVTDARPVLPAAANQTDLQGYVLYSGLSATLSDNSCASVAVDQLRRHYGIGPCAPNDPFMDSIQMTCDSPNFVAFLSTAEVQVFDASNAPVPRAQFIFDYTAAVRTTYPGNGRIMRAINYDYPESTLEIVSDQAPNITHWEVNLTQWHVAYNASQRTPYPSSSSDQADPASNGLGGCVSMSVTIVSSNLYLTLISNVPYGTSQQRANDLGKLVAGDSVFAMSPMFPEQDNPYLLELLQANLTGKVVPVSMHDPASGCSTSTTARGGPIARSIVEAAEINVTLAVMFETAIRSESMHPRDAPGKHMEAYFGSVFPGDLRAAMDSLAAAFGAPPTNQSAWCGPAESAEAAASALGVPATSVHAVNATYFAVPATPGMRGSAGLRSACTILAVDASSCTPADAARLKSALASLPRTGVALVSLNATACWPPPSAAPPQVAKASAKLPAAAIAAIAASSAAALACAGAGAAAWALRRERRTAHAGSKRHRMTL